MMSVRPIEQRDILYFLTRNELFPFFTQTRLIALLKELNAASADNVGKVIKGQLKKVNMSNITSETFYKKVFEDEFEIFFKNEKYNEEQKEDYKNKILQKYIDFVKKRKVCFTDCEGTREDTIESYMIRMFDEGLNKGSSAAVKAKPNPDKEKNIDINNCYSIESTNVFLEPLFIGREDLMTQMQKKMRDNSCVVLRGIGGIGKTQLALQYVKKHRKD